MTLNTNYKPVGVRVASFRKFATQVCSATFAGSCVTCVYYILGPSGTSSHTMSMQHAGWTACREAWSRTIGNTVLLVGREVCGLLAFGFASDLFSFTLRRDLDLMPIHPATRLPGRG